MKKQTQEIISQEDLIELIVEKRFKIKDSLITDFVSLNYVSPTSFSAEGDITPWLKPGDSIVITFQNSETKEGIITSFSYDSEKDKTIISITGDKLINKRIISVLLTLKE